jgi:hypothetical protein
MGRKRNAPPDENPTASESSAVAVAEPPPQNGTPEANGEAKRRPAATFAAMTDRTTRVEIAAWANVHQGQNGEYTQYSLTFRRSWRDAQNQWHDGGSYRVHDVPVLLYLLQRAYDFCVAQRAEVKIDGDCPF